MPMDLRQLFTAYYASIWRLLRRLGAPAAQLDDAAQEVFWVAARRLGDIVPGSEHPFLYGVALRTSRRFLRRQAGLPVCDSDSLPHLVDPSPTPEERVQEQQMREVLDQVLGRMPIELRAVFVLYELEELEVAEIAKIEGIPVGTASSRLRRARRLFSAISRRFRAATRTLEG